MRRARVYCVRSLLKMKRHVETERFGSLEINHQFELDSHLDGKLARIRAFEDAVDIGRRSKKIIVQVSAVGQQAADFGEGTPHIDGR